MSSEIKMLDVLIIVVNTPTLNRINRGKNEIV